MSSTSGARTVIDFHWATVYFSACRNLNVFQILVRNRSEIFEGAVDRWDQNQVRPTVKKMKMGLVYRIKISGEWYFFDTGGFTDEKITAFFSVLKSGASICGGVYRKRGHNCISWIVGDGMSIPPSNVLFLGLLCSVGFLLGLLSFRLLSLLAQIKSPENKILELFSVFGELPLVVILMPTAALGLLVAPFGIANAFNPRKLRAMINYRREIARRTLGVEP
jgi:hypothetical protein